MCNFVWRPLEGGGPGGRWGPRRTQGPGRRRGGPEDAGGPRGRWGGQRTPGGPEDTGGPKGRRGGGRRTLGGPEDKVEDLRHFRNFFFCFLFYGGGENLRVMISSPPAGETPPLDRPFSVTNKKTFFSLLKYLN